MTSQTHDQHYFYEIERGKAGRTNLSIYKATKAADGELQQGDYIVGASTGSGYVGVKSRGMGRAAPELAQELVEAVDAHVEKNFSEETFENVKNTIHRVTHALARPDLPIPAADSHVARLENSQNARIGDRAKNMKRYAPESVAGGEKISPQYARVAKTYPNPSLIR